MRLAVLGSRHFGAMVLQELFLAHYEIAAVVAPDAGDRIATAAAGLGLPLATLDGRDRVTAMDLPSEVDLIVAAHCHAFVDAGALGRARLGGIGYHPSLLPRHRGRDAVAWTIRCGDAIAGGSVYRLAERMDAGDVVAQGWCFVRAGESARDLWERALSPIGARLLCQAVADAAVGTLRATPQDEAFATWAPPISRPA